MSNSIELFSVMALAVIYNTEILTICLLNTVLLVDNAGVIVNPKGEMKGTLQILHI